MKNNNIMLYSLALERPPPCHAESERQLGNRGFLQVELNIPLVKFIRKLKLMSFIFSLRLLWIKKKVKLNI